MNGAVYNELVVKGGMVVDGTGRPSEPADVRVSNGVITEVGPNLTVGSARTIDASEAYVAPGFIDSHTHLDPSMFWDPFCDPMPQHGVTTVVTGNCSLSLVPVRPDTVQSVSDVFCFIEDMPTASFAEGIPWTWETFAEYRDSIDKNGLAVHAVALLGHSVLRMYVMGDDSWNRAATEEERTLMARVLDESMAAGAFGFSTSRLDVDRHQRPVPSRLADLDELDSLLAVVGARGGHLVEFIPNLLGEHGMDDLEELARACGRRGVTSIWNGLAHSARQPENSKNLMATVRGLRSEGIDVWPMMSPRTVDFRIGWQSSFVFLQFPKSWHRIPNADDDAQRRRLLGDPDWRATARVEWDAVEGQLFPTRSLDRVRLIEVARPELNRWLGHTFSDLAADRGGHPSDVLADWVLENELRPGVVVVGVANSDAEAVAELLVDPDTLVSASDAGAHVQMMCAAGDTTLLLTRHVRDRQDLSVEQAVHELTGRQAEVCGLRSRGYVREGLRADLTVFALEDLAWESDEFVPDLPTGASRLRRPAGGYRFTLADGVVTQEDGELTGALPARVLDSRTA
jgi:N-acyl-D-amino-acid deacylase